MRGIGANALASSIVLVCRKRPADAPSISRREFIRELNGVLPEALDEMTKGSGDERSPVAPVDLSQAIIGPGMAVFSKYAAVLEADGSPMSVRTALQLINRFLAEDDFDADTQFCLHWFEQHGWTESVFGEADVLARSKSTSVDAMKEAGVLQSGSGRVRLLKWAEYPTDWDPRTDKRTPVWEALHQPHSRPQARWRHQRRTTPRRPQRQSRSRAPTRLPPLHPLRTPRPRRRRPRLQRTHHQLDGDRERQQKHNIFRAAGRIQSMKIELIKELQVQFDALVQTHPEEEGLEFWFARDLQERLGYARWENFLTVIGKAIQSCKTTGYDPDHHFRGVTKMVPIGSGADRGIEDFMLTRYACYLLAQNGDPRKEPIAFAQSYFALQTRKAGIDRRAHLASPQA